MRMSVCIATVCAAAALATPGSALADVRTFTLREGPIPVAGYDTVFPSGRVATPRVNGSIVGMHARLVDRRGRRVTIRDVMLHHVFFHRTRRTPVDMQCAGRGAEAFYGTGEEDQRLRLPAGYGYPLRRDDRWSMRAMLMSHTQRSLDVYVEYEVKVETRRRLTPVQAFWLRAQGCTGGAGYWLDGNGIPGSTNDKTFEWTVPYDLRIVAVGGHLHGGAKDMWLSQPRCGDRRLLDNRPLYAPPDHLYYRARPILHEPGPIDTRYFMSATGVAATRGETLRLHGFYDAELPRTVMAVMHVYVAREPRARRECQPLPADAAYLTKPGPVRTEPPQVTVPLNTLDSRGRLTTIVDPLWPVTALGPKPEVEVGDDGFRPRRFSVTGPTQLTWRFTGAVGHNVRLATGPRLIVTPTFEDGQTVTTALTVPGRYTLFCTRHPMTMHAIMDVRP